MGGQKRSGAGLRGVRWMARNTGGARHRSPGVNRGGVATSTGKEPSIDPKLYLHDAMLRLAEGADPATLTPRQWQERYAAQTAEPSCSPRSPASSGSRHPPVIAPTGPVGAAGGLPVTLTAGRHGHEDVHPKGITSATAQATPGWLRTSTHGAAVAP